MRQPDIVNTQQDLSQISISHISPSGAKRRYVQEFMPASERALATIRSHSDRNKGLSNDNKSRGIRTKRLMWDFGIRWRTVKSCKCYMYATRPSARRKKVRGRMVGTVNSLIYNLRRLYRSLGAVFLSHSKTDESRERCVSN